MNRPLHFMAFIASLSLVATCPASAQQAVSIDPSAVERKMQQLVESWPIPGLALSIVSRDGLVYEGGFGERTIGGERDPVDADTVFKINSMTKAMAATIIGMLADEGAMKFDDRVATHLPWFRLYDPWVSQDVRINDLLTHRTGVFCNDWLDDVPHMSWEEGIRRMRFMPQAAPLRDRFKYCDWAYGVATMAAATVDGGWDEALATRIFEPLEMRRTFSDIHDVVDNDGVAVCHECELIDGVVEPDTVTRVANVASPHVDVDGRLVTTGWRHMPSRGSSSVLSSAHDMGRFLQLYLNDGRVGTRRLISDSAIGEILEPRILTGVDPGTDDLPGFETAQARTRFWNVAYGYGWHIGRYADHRILHHGGDSLGFESLMLLLPDRGAGIVVLVNYNHMNRGVVSAAVMQVLDLLLGLPPIEWTDFHKKHLRKRLAGVEASWARLTESPEAGLTDAIVAQVSGAYCSAAYGTLHVRRMPEGWLRLDQGPERWGKLTLRENETYVLRWNGPRNQPRQVSFHFAKSGKAATMTINGADFERCDSRIP